MDSMRLLSPALVEKPGLYSRQEIFFVALGQQLAPTYFGTQHLGIHYLGTQYDGTQYFGTQFSGISDLTY